MFCVRFEVIHCSLQPNKSPLLHNKALPENIVFFATCSTNCSCSCYFVRSCIYNRICVVGKKETIYPLVQTVNALYLQLLEMQKAFTAPDFTPDNLTTLVKMWLGYFLTKNISDFYLMAFPVWSSLTHHFSA